MYFVKILKRDSFIELWTLRINVHVSEFSGIADFVDLLPASRSLKCVANDYEARKSAFKIVCIAFARSLLTIFELNSVLLYNNQEYSTKLKFQEIYIQLICNLKNIFYRVVSQYSFTFSWIFIPFWESEENIFKSLNYVCILTYENNFY